jgi:hypothetical protein
MQAEKKKHTTLGWKIYFVAILIFSLPTYLTQDYSRFWELFDALYFFVAAIGMWAFCWNKHLFGRFFWQAFFWTDLVWNLLYAYVFPLHPGYDAVADGLVSRPILAMGTLLLFAPMTIALYLYAFNRPGLWKTPEPQGFDPGI